MRKIKFTPNLSTYNIKSWSFILLCTTCLFLGINCIIVILSLQKSLQNNFEDQLNILSYESHQIIESHYATLEGIVHHLTHTPGNIVINFEKYTRTIGKYTSNTVLLADSSHNIIALSPTPKASTKNLNISSRNYIKDMLDYPGEIHIGHLVQGIATKIWSIPIVKGILIDNKHLGTVILSVPLTKFSEGLLKSNIALKSVQFDHTNSDKIQDLEADNNIITPKSIREILSLKTIFLSSFSRSSDITISEIFKPMSNVSENITLVMQGAHLQQLFWTQFLYNFILFSLVALCVALGIFLFDKKLFRKLVIIEEKILDSISKLQYLIPEYNTPYLETHIRLGARDKILFDIEHFVDSNAHVIKIIKEQKDIIIEKDKQLSILQLHFRACLNTFFKESLYFVEKIEDLYYSSNSIDPLPSDKNNSSLNQILYQDQKRLLLIFEEIYCYSKSHEEYLLLFKPLILKAQTITTGSKKLLNIEALLSTTFAHKYASLYVQKHMSTGRGSTSVIDQDNLSEGRKMFFIEAVEATIASILEISDQDNCCINLTQQDDSISIEIKFNLTESSIDKMQIGQAVEKARLFALLDEGFIALYRVENELIITIVYTASANRGFSKNI